MNEWKKLSRDCERSAQKLRDSGYLRGCVNRAYYAAYSAATMLLLANGYTPGARREGPPHGDVLDMTGRVTSIPADRLDIISQKMRTLYKMRLDADYFAKRTIDARMAQASLLICRSVLKELGVT